MARAKPKTELGKVASFADAAIVAGCSVTHLKKHLVRFTWDRDKATGCPVFDVEELLEFRRENYRKHAEKAVDAVLKLRPLNIGSLSSFIDDIEEIYPELFNNDMEGK